MKRLDYYLEAVGITFTAVQTQEVFQLISLILTCISITFSLGFTIYNWFKSAFSDKKITSEEINELKENINEELNKIERKE